MHVNEDEFNDRAEYNLGRIGENLPAWLNSSGLRCSAVSDRELGHEGSSDVPLEVSTRHDSDAMERSSALSVKTSGV
jgi:hypothetical protein